LGRSTLRVGLLAVAAAVLLHAAASAHPGHGHWLSVGNGQFDPAAKKVIVGSTVTWYWDWPDLDHTVTADPGQAESFDSDPSGTPDHPLFDTYQHRFTQVGTFTYHCRVHPAMAGTVEVTEKPVSPPPNQQPAPPAGSALTLTDLRINVRRRRVAFTVSYASTVRVHVARRVHASWRLLRAFDTAATAGRNRVRIRPRTLAPGRYRIRVAARDGAGNRSTSLSTRFRLERAKGA
jgi:plastocyanin